MSLRSGLIGLTLTSVVALASANAADIYVPGPAAPGGYKDVPYAPGWAGFYAGVNGGYGWSADDSKLSAKADNQVCIGGACIPTLFSGTRAFDTRGGFGGGQIGYNWQPVSGGYKDGPVLSRFVLGIEADIQGSGIDGGTALLFGSIASASAKNELDWFGTVRGRVGYTFGQSLLYATGGFAFGGVKDTLSVTPVVGATSTVHRDEVNTGFVVGGGIEHLFSPAWSVKAEYQFIDLGSDKLSTTAGAPPFTAAASLDAEHTYHTVRVGLNYHFHNDFVPLK